MDNSWIGYFIPIVAIAGGITFVIFSQYFSMKRDVAQAGNSPELIAALAESHDVNTKLLARLDSIDARLGAIERTLHEVG